MLFKKTRTLKDKVFGTQIAFVDFGERDSVGVIDTVAKAKEQNLIDDFGAPVVSAGKEFIGHVKKDSDKILLTTKEDTDAVEIKFVLTEKQLPVTTGFVAPLVVDARNVEAVEGKLTAEQVAEAKCLVFEQVMEARLLQVIEGLKAKFTAFESEELEEIAIPVPGTV